MVENGKSDDVTSVSAVAVPSETPILFYFMRGYVLFLSFFWSVWDKLLCTSI
jgi:hypothetical protein